MASSNGSAIGAVSTRAQVLPMERRPCLAFTRLASMPSAG